MFIVYHGTGTYVRLFLYEFQDFLLADPSDRKNTEKMALWLETGCSAFLLWFLTDQRKYGLLFLHMCLLFLLIRSYNPVVGNPAI